MKLPVGKNEPGEPTVAQRVLCTLMCRSNATLYKNKDGDSNGLFG